MLNYSHLNKRIIATGGPGAGKTTTLNALSNLGYDVAPDAAREIIRERRSQGLSPRPSPDAFAQQCLERDISEWHKPRTTTCFFERGICDAAASLMAAGAMTRSAAIELSRQYPYDTPVLLFPPWAEIYTMDAERDQDFEHATRVFAAISDWYAELGYDVVLVPQASVAERVEFIQQLVETT